MSRYLFNDCESDFLTVRGRHIVHEEAAFECSLRRNKNVSVSLEHRISCALDKYFIRNTSTSQVICSLSMYLLSVAAYDVLYPSTSIFASGWYSIAAECFIIRWARIYSKDIDVSRGSLRLSTLVRVSKCITQSLTNISAIAVAEVYLSATTSISLYNI